MPHRGSQVIPASTPEPTESSVPANESGQGKASAGESPAHSIERLFREHNESLERLLCAKLHSSQEAKEVAQEAYVQLLGLRDPSTVSYLRAFLFRTALNLATDRIRQRTSRRRIDELMPFESEEARSPERASSAEQELALLNRALEELPEACRQAFVLVHFADLSFDEAAKRLGLHPRSVRRFVARAVEHCHRVVYEGGAYQGGLK